MGATEQEQHLVDIIEAVRGLSRDLELLGDAQLGPMEKGFVTPTGGEKRSKGELPTTPQYTTLLQRLQTMQWMKQGIRKRKWVIIQI